MTDRDEVVLPDLDSGASDQSFPSNTLEVHRDCRRNTREGEGRIISAFTFTAVYQEVRKYKKHGGSIVIVYADISAGMKC